MASKTAKKLKRLAASLVFLREKNSAVPGDQFEVLLVQRSLTISSPLQLGFSPVGFTIELMEMVYLMACPFRQMSGFYEKYVYEKRLKRQVFCRCRQKLQIVQCETSSRGKLGVREFMRTRRSGRISNLKLLAINRIFSARWTQFVAF